MLNEQSNDRLVILCLLTLTFVTGLIDAASFLSMGHVFTANMTGNIVFLGFAFAGTPGLSVARSLEALACAFVGGFLAQRLAKLFSSYQRRIWLTAAWCVEAILLLLAAIFVWRSAVSEPTADSIYLLIALTALAMGVRNGSMRKLAIPDLTTTVLTLTLAALAFDFSLTSFDNVRWRRRLSAVVAMLTGAFCGALLVHGSLALLMAVAAMLTLLCALTQLFVANE